MRAVSRFLGSRWVLTGIGALLLALLAWFFGPLLAFLEPVTVRAAVVAVIALAWLSASTLISYRRRRADQTLAEGVTAGAVDPSAAASAEEVAALRDKLTAAMALLKRARSTRGYLYEQPWYAIIGPPGAGKTTALLNAGLKFPLAAEMGQGAVAGVGGTRLCDWWFTEDAVLIDTAGRYTTQDSDAAVDRAGWEGFLDLLKRTRGRQPLNGVIVASALSDIAAAPPPERLAHARAVRRRIKEITDRLGLRVPIYALFTKADLLTGFTEYFDDLDRDRRAQVWGITFPVQRNDAGPLAAFGAEFRALVDRLDARVLDRLQAERSPDRRVLLAGFPAQVASLEAPLAEFLTEAFGGSRLDPAPFLRGVYMTSGVQEGTPIDRLTGVLARSFGIDQRRAPSLRPEQGRSYFLARLLREVVFGEAMLVAANPAAARRRLLLRGAAWAVCVLAVLGGSTLFWRARESNAAAIGSFGAALAKYDTTASGLSLDPVADADLPRILPLLDQARAMPYGHDHRVGAGLGVGLSQTAKLTAAGEGLYRHALDRVLLPRLLWRLETQMRGNLNRPDFLYEATRVYLMLGSAGPPDRDLVRAWMALDWQAAYPGAVQAPVREDLARHLDALLADPLPQVSLDGALVEDAQRAFSHIPLAERVYSRIRPSAAAQRLPPWQPSDAVGASGVQVFVRNSGKPLTEGIPGFYTVDGFRKVLLRDLPQAVQDVARESWVLGPRSEVDPHGPQLQTLERDVVALYTAEYQRQWDALLADLAVVPLRTLPQAVQELYILGSPQSPMRDLLAGIARQLTLSQPNTPSPSNGSDAAAASKVADAAQATDASRLQGVLGAASGSSADSPVRTFDDYYKPLRDLVGSGSGAPIDGVLKLINDLQVQLAALNTASVGSAAPPAAPGVDPTQMLRAEATRQPEPVSRWLLSLAESGARLRAGGAKQQVAAAWGGAAAAAGGGSGPALLCREAVEGRYPFVAGAANETPMGDFVRLFAPGGLLDAFFNTQLRPFVDMSGRVWRPQAVDGVLPPVSPGTVAQFQRAAAIRDLFFGAGGQAPSVRFDITSVSTDPGAGAATLDLDGVQIQSASGPARSTQVTWPGPNGMTNVRLAFGSSGSEAPLTASGPWALFRLFGKGTLSNAGSAEKFTLSFRSGERQAVFDINAASVLNPFAPGVLQAFRCPVL